jgi:hypothetical protein
MKLKRATVVFLSLLLVPLVTGVLNGCSFDFSNHYECHDSSSADAGKDGAPRADGGSDGQLDAAPEVGPDAGFDAGAEGGADAAVDSGTEAASPLPDAGTGFPLAWIVPVLSWEISF